MFKFFKKNTESKIYGLKEKRFTCFYLNGYFFSPCFRSMVASPYKIPSGSMIPTLKIGDFIFVSKLSYGLKSSFYKL